MCVNLMCTLLCVRCSYYFWYLYVCHALYLYVCQSDVYLARTIAGAYMCVTHSICVCVTHSVCMYVTHFIHVCRALASRTLFVRVTNSICVYVTHFIHVCRAPAISRGPYGLWLMMASDVRRLRG